MREIKLRVWDKDTKIFIYQSLRELLNGIGDDCADCLAQDFRYAVARGGVPEQATGLKDKNGVEIYDGDTVKVPDTIPCKVCWSNPRAEWWLSSKKMGWSFGYYAQLRFENKPVIEIISNIHEKLKEE